jgi:peptidoglycan/xylan/chitin deacetylase (PgdA/CDA1 family)
MIQASSRGSWPQAIQRRVAGFGRRAKNAIAPLVPLKLLIDSKQPGPLILFVHGIGKDKPFINSLYDSHSPESFVSMLDQLLRHMKPLEDLSLESIRNARSDQFIATFDDGLRSAYEYAAPVLEQRGIPAIFFINPGFFDDTNHFYRFEAGLLAHKIRALSHDQLAKLRHRLSAVVPDSVPMDQYVLSIKYVDRALLTQVADGLQVEMKAILEAEKPFMSVQQVKDLQARGFYLGAHSIDHPRFTDISEDEQVRQAVVSTREMVAKFSLPYRYFAFPFGSAGVKESFFNMTRDDIDVFFTTSGWKRPDIGGQVFHREALDAVGEPIRYLQRMLLLS